MGRVRKVKSIQDLKRSGNLTGKDRQMPAGDILPPASDILFAWNGVNGGSGLGITFATHRGEHFLASSGITRNSGKTALKRVALSPRGDSSGSRGHCTRLTA